ncbi:MAG: zinc ribbon domain-containing protein, partial [Syntrophomonadaceae bacterium]|nr:zinc ribbon domain-containing protein [Syntrophomonadaceae bacterium]
MLCPHCGADSPKNVRFCTECGSAMPEIAEKKEPSGGNLIGFSSRINDPAFARYVKNKKRWALLFASILALIVIVAFFIYGQTSSEMDNPQALFIGLGIGGMFITIALLACISINRSTTWDGIVVDKKIEQKKRRHRTGDNDFYWEKYTLYTVVIKRDSGKIHNKTAE